MSNEKSSAQSSPQSSPAPSRRALFTGAGVATAGAVGAVVASASSAQAAPAAGAIELLASPVRGYDSRVTDGKLAAKTIRTVSLVGIPANSTGVIANINATKGDARGFVIAFPGGTPKTVTSTVKFERNVPTSNTTITKLGPANTLSFYVSQNVHVVVDITGTIG